MLQPSEYQLVVLECPYRIWDHELVQSLFPKMVSLKLKGYQTAYGKYCMPIDTTDFIATHLVLCSKEAGTLQPIMAFRSIELNRCDEYNVPFSALSLVKAAKDAGPLVPYVEKSIAECKEAQVKLYYISSWTIRPDIRTSQQTLNQHLTSLFASLIWFQHHQQNPIQLIAAASIQFRVTHLLGLLGFKMIQYEGVECPSFGVASLNQTRARLMDVREFSTYAPQLAKKFQALWENRIVVADASGNIDSDDQKAA